jgi:hypothetical protein
VRMYWLSTRSVDFMARKLSDRFGWRQPGNDQG